MARGRILSMVLAGALLIGSLGACAPAAPQPPAGGGPAQVSPEAPTAGVPTVDEIGLQRGIVVITQNETPAFQPGRHGAVAGMYKNAMLHNGLLRLHYQTLEPIYDLATGWTALSDTEFEFTIHEGVLFHNGEELTAYDFAASWEYSRQTTDAWSAKESLVSWEVVDRHTIRISTGDYPNAMIFYDLTNHVNKVQPRSLIEAGHDFNERQVGTGPFEFVEWRFGDSLHFRAFEDYFDRDRAARVETVVWRIVPEGASRTIAMEIGEADFNVYVALPDIPRLEAHPDVEVLMMPSTEIVFMRIQTQEHPFNNHYVRQAVDMAIDREALVMAGFDGHAIPWRSQMPPGFPGSTNVGIREFDPEGARAILAQQGIDPSTLGFSLLCTNEERRRMGEVVQAQLAEIGIPVSVEMIDLATGFQFQADGTFQAIFGGTQPSNILSFLRTTYYFNPIRPNAGRIYNTELNALINQAVATIDANERIPIVERISENINAHIGTIPTHLPLIVRAHNSNLVVPEHAAVGQLHINMMYWRE